MLDVLHVCLLCRHLPSSAGAEALVWGSCGLSARLLDQACAELWQDSLIEKVSASLGPQSGRTVALLMILFTFFVLFDSWNPCFASGSGERSGQQAERRSGEAEEDQGPPWTPALLGVTLACSDYGGGFSLTNQLFNSFAVCVFVASTRRPPVAVDAQLVCPRRSKSPMFNCLNKVWSCQICLLLFHFWFLLE